VNTQAILEAKQGERAKSVEFVDATLAEVVESGRKLSDAELRQLDTHKSLIEGLDIDIRSLADFVEAAESAVVIDQLIGARGRSSHRQPAPYKPQTFGGEQFRSFGDLYVEDEGFNARGLLNHRVQVDDIDLVDLAYKTRALLTEGADPGKLLLPQPDRYVASTPTFATPLLDAITKVPITGNSVDILTYGEFSGSDVVPEGAQKPESVAVVGSNPTPLEVIAGWVKYTRQLAEDAPGFASWLNQGLTRDVLRKLQAKVAAVLAAASLPATTGAAGQPLIEVVRLAMADVQERGFNPTALFASPHTLANLDISVLNLGGAAGTVLGNGNWSLQPIPVSGMTDVIVADPADAFVIFTKRGVSMYTTDSDITDGTPVKSDFRANILTTLAETRAKGAVQNPNAAQKAVLTP
jgi:HK97 family phage major capsid protein